MVYLTNGLTGFLYSIDASNNFTWGPWSDFLPDGAVLLQLILMCPLVFLESEIPIKKKIILCLLYLGIPALSIMCEIFGGPLMLLYPAQTISMLLLYINAQREQEKQVLEKELELSNNRMKLLFRQIQPHFIYNTLGTIGQLCLENPKGASDLVTEFSMYLRGSLVELDNVTPILLSQEMEYVQHYVSIEQVRFPDMEIKYDLQSSDFFLPALSIQPLVENAVKHGLMGMETGGTIIISTYETESEYGVCVFDNGVGFDSSVFDDGNTHIGIKNIQERVVSMCKGTLTVESEKGKGTKALIVVPKGGEYDRIGGR